MAGRRGSDHPMIQTRSWAATAADRMTAAALRYHGHDTPWLAKDLGRHEAGRG